MKSKNFDLIILASTFAISVILFISLISVNTSLNPFDSISTPQKRYKTNKDTVIWRIHQINLDEIEAPELFREVEKWKEIMVK